MGYSHVESNPMLSGNERSQGMLDKLNHIPSIKGVPSLAGLDNSNN